MFLGNHIDDALSAYGRRSSSTPTGWRWTSLELYREHWHAELEAEREKRASTGTRSCPSAPCSRWVGRRSSSRWPSSCRTSGSRSTCSAGSVDARTRPRWTVHCYLDLRDGQGTGRRGADTAVVDFKVKGSPISRTRPTGTPRPGSTSPVAGSRVERRKGCCSRRSPSPAYVEIDICRAMLRRELCCRASGMCAGGRGSGCRVRHSRVVQRLSRNASRGSGAR